MGVIIQRRNEPHLNLAQTVSTLYTFYLVMALFPNVQTKAQEEIDRVAGNDRLPVLGDCDSLPYLSALQSEVYRWGPVGPTGLSRCSAIRTKYELFSYRGLSQDDRVHRTQRILHPERLTHYCECMVSPGSGSRVAKQRPTSLGACFTTPQCTPIRSVFRQSAFWNQVINSRNEILVHVLSASGGGKPSLSIIALHETSSHMLRIRSICPGMFM